MDPGQLVLNVGFRLNGRGVNGFRFWEGAEFELGFGGCLWWEYTRAEGIRL